MYLLRVVRFFFFYSNSITSHMTFKSTHTVHLTSTPTPTTRTLGQTRSRSRTNSRIWIRIWVWIGGITGTGIIIITVTVIITGPCTMWRVIWICWITSWPISFTASASVAIWRAYKSELASNIMYNRIKCYVCNCQLSIVNHVSCYMLASNILYININYCMWGVLYL